MASLFFNFIRMLMMTTPFITMIVMVLALWGVGGKTTYIGLDLSTKTVDDGLKDKNILVSDVKATNKDICSTELKNQDKAVDSNQPDTNKKESSYEKIDWENTV